jgi:hypothetical protein
MEQEIPVITRKISAIPNVLGEKYPEIIEPIDFN